MVKITDLPSSALSPPEPTDGGTVPPNDGGGLHDDERPTPLVERAREPDPKDPIQSTQAWPWCRRPPKHRELWWSTRFSRARARRLCREESKVASTTRGTNCLSRRALCHGGDARATSRRCRVPHPTLATRRFPDADGVFGRDRHAVDSRMDSIARVALHDAFRGQHRRLDLSTGQHWTASGQHYPHDPSGYRPNRARGGLARSVQGSRRRAARSRENLRRSVPARIIALGAIRVPNSLSADETPDGSPS
jgi:hypothetical protein